MNTLSSVIFMEMGIVSIALMLHEPKLYRLQYT